VKFSEHPQIEAIRGDITQQDVDVIVNTANRAMRGGGGVDGAIHRVGGPAILRDCIHRFPDGLATGDAGWTTAGDLPAKWVIHTVGPNYRAGQRDRSLLESCYRRALEVADDLGARSVTLPLVSTGTYGWPEQDAIAAAVNTIAAAKTRVEQVRLVAFEQPAFHAVRHQIDFWTPMRILQGIRAVHLQGYHRIRPRPGSNGVSPWRVIISQVSGPHFDMPSDHQASIAYTWNSRTDFAGGTVTAGTSPDSVAELILDALPGAAPTADDPEFVTWFATLMKVVEATVLLPIGYSDYLDEDRGWEIGEGSGIRYPNPPLVPS
jgi:O-acetyl-ADP-ribose deacetylase (regulator of RNase III)